MRTSLGNRILFSVFALTILALVWCASDVQAASDSNAESAAGPPTISPFSLSEGGCSILRDGIEELSVTALPLSCDSCPAGFELGHNKFTQLSVSPDASKIAIAVAGPNHEWMGIVSTATGGVDVIRVLYGGGVGRFIWSDNGTMVAAEVAQASGFYNIVVVSLESGQVSDVLTALRHSGVSASSAYNPSFAPTNCSLEFETNTTEGKVILTCETLFAESAQPLNEVSAKAAEAKGTDYPNATWMPAASGNYGVASRTSADMYWIVLHTTEGTADSAISWFQNASSGVSAHYLVKRDGSVVQLVRDKDIAYHAGNYPYNQKSIGIEHERYGSSNWTEAQFTASANLVKWLANQYAVTIAFPSGIAPAVPTNGIGIIGHNQVPDPSNPSLGGGASHHTDPVNWDWSHYKSLFGTQAAPIVSTLAATLVTVSSAQMNGSVNPNGATASAWFQYGTTTSYGSSTGSLTGITSTVNIQSAWSSLSPSTTYHYRVAASNSGGTSYGNDASFTTPPSAVTLTLYVHNGSATGPLLVGARVTGSDAGGATFDKTTGSGGYVTITGTPGTWQFSATMSGYSPNSWPQSITTTGQRDAFLSPLADTQSPTIQITSPTSSGTYSTSTASVNLGGTASDNVGVVQVIWSNNRGGGATASGTTSWSANGISLSSGQNVITVTAYDLAGNHGQAIITVTYTPQITISVSANPSSGGSCSGGGTYPSGQTVTVTASASTGYTFSNWTESGSVVSSSSSYSFTASGNRTLVANFTQVPYTISVSANPSSGGSCSGGGTYSSGQTVTVTASASTGYTFSNWTESGSVVSSSSSYSFTASGNRTLVANFAASTASIVGSLTLEGRPAKPNAAWVIALDIVVVPPTPAIAYETTATTGNNGTFTLSGLTPGLNQIWVKNSHTLAVTKSVTIATGTNNVDFGILPEGDSSNDNTVALVDFSILVTTFGKNVGQPGFDSRADFNQNGSVTLVDFSLLATRFGQVGPVRPPVKKSIMKSLLDAILPKSLPSDDLSFDASPSDEERGASISVLLATAKVMEGESFEVTIEAQIDGQAIDGAAACLAFDPAVLQVEDVQSVGELPVLLANKVDNETGTVTFAAGAFSNLPSGSIPLARVTFRAVGLSDGALLTLINDGDCETAVTSKGICLPSAKSDGLVVVESARQK